VSEKPIFDSRDPISGVTRRRFAQLAAAAAAVLPSALPATLAAQEVPAQPQQSQLSAAAQAEVDARIAWTFGKYGARLDDAQKADIRRLITGSYAGFEQMRAYPLDNSVEPSTVFRVWRAAPRRAFVPKVERKEKS
jgi:CubicO group peptidase (beta-lactamase class C family)